MTFFSGTDLNTLKEEGIDRNHFVSLIVNNEGTYTAAITRKLLEKKVVTNSFKYKSFNDVEKEGESTAVLEGEVIEYNTLDVIKEGEVEGMFQEIDERLDTIKENKSKKSNNKDLAHNFSLPPYTYPDNSKIAKQYALFDEEYMDSEPLRKVESDFNIKIDTSVVKSITLQLITGSIAIADSSKIDPIKWANQMVGLFDRRFEGDMHLFTLWVESMADFILTNFIPKEYRRIEDDYISELSKAVYTNLKSLPKNKYIRAIQDTLTIWMN